MFKVNNKDTKMTPWSCSGIFIVNFEHISHFVPVFLLLILSRQMPAGLVFSFTISSETLIGTVTLAKLTILKII